ncbi:hypothetical protein [Okeania sp. KiyG1]|uniref:hypothetical protein n=1 Tax=Okeania sp. KiyG1 TaxID=2720165 RepID=UPI0019248439|nr:hypothetical protein [Okeania sp. KiyG1]
MNKEGLLTKSEVRSQKRCDPATTPARLRSDPATTPARLRNADQERECAPRESEVFL